MDIIVLRWVCRNRGISLGQSQLEIDAGLGYEVGSDSNFLNTKQIYNNYSWKYIQITVFKCPGKLKAAS